MKGTALIIGAGIGGLATGALLARRGWRVVILERSSAVGGCCQSFSRSGFRFDTGPTLHPYIPNGGLDFLFRELGLYLERIFINPFSQVCIPGHRIGLYKDEGGMLEEWGREFPGDFYSVQVMYERLQSIEAQAWSSVYKKDTGQKERANLPRALKGAVLKVRQKRAAGGDVIPGVLDTPSLLKGFDLQTLFWGQTEFSNSILAFAAATIGLPHKGGFFIKGGSEGICGLLSQYIIEKGGKIRYNCSVKKVVVNRKKAACVLLEKGEGLEGSCYISNTTPWTLYKGLLSDAVVSPRIAKQISKIPSPSGVFSLFLGVREKCIPSEMGNALFLCTDEGPDPLFMSPLYISLSHSADNGSAPEGCRAMRAFTYTPVEEWRLDHLYNDKKRLYEKRIIQSLKRLIPFLEEGLCVKESATPLTYERFTGRPGGIVKGVPQRPSVVGNKALSCSTGIRDLYQIGDCTSPGFGVEAVCRNALMLSDLICKQYN